MTLTSADGPEPQRGTPSAVFGRRRCLVGSVAWLGLATLAVQDAMSQAARTESALSRDLRARGLRSDALSIEFPPLADSGHSVPFTVEVQAPAGRRLTALEVLLPENPFPAAVKLRLAVPQAQYRFSTRLRLAASQQAWAIATFDDGSQQAAAAATVVTSSACLDES